jgi:hypothetical protein
VRHLVELVVGDVGRDAHEVLGRRGPRRVGVRVVELPRDVVDADDVTQLYAHRVDDEAGEEVLAEHLARPFSAEVLARPRRVHVVGAVEALEEVRDPSGAALGERELDVGIVLDHA